MSAPTLGQRVLSRLVRNLGGHEAAARRLDISEGFLRAYLEGRKPVPERIWLKAVDLLMDELMQVGPSRSAAPRQRIARQGDGDDVAGGE